MTLPFMLTNTFPFVVMRKTYDSHFDAFLAFADTQPFARVIDHRNNGWCGCAVGDYHREAQSIPPKGQEDLVDLTIRRSKSPLLSELANSHRYIYESLSNGRVPESVEEDYEIQTYHGLATFMKAFVNVDWDEEEDTFDEGY